MGLHKRWHVWWPLSYQREVRDSVVSTNRRFPEITGKDNLTMFSYSGRVQSPEWRRQRRRANLRQFQIFRHGPIIIYTRLPAGGTYYPICMFPTNRESISDALLPLFTGIRHLAHVLTVPPIKAWLLCATPAGRQAMPVGTYRMQSPGFPKIVYFRVHCPPQGP